MMPGIIISAIFREQGKLMFRATPVQNEFAGVEEPVNNPADGVRLQISAANLPRSAQIVEAVSEHAIEAAIQAANQSVKADNEIRQALCRELEEARYEAAL